MFLFAFPYLKLTLYGCQSDTLKSFNLTLSPSLKSLNLTLFTRLMHSQSVLIYTAQIPSALALDKPRLLEFRKRTEHPAPAQRRFFLERGDRRKAFQRLIRSVAGKRVKHKPCTITAHALFELQHSQYAIPAHFDSLL